MDNIITKIEDLTPERLTSILRQSGTLARGDVAAISVRLSKTLFVSRISYLEVRYTSAEPTAPRHLFLKISKNERHSEPVPEWASEIIFYSNVAGEMPQPPVPRCFDAVFSHATGRWHLLLEDLSATHAAASPVPSFDKCTLAIDSLAEIHAYWWEHPRLGQDVGRFLTMADVEKLTREVAANHDRFAEAFGDSLSAAQRTIYSRVLATFPRPWLRLTGPKGLTLTHGDAHLGNFLYPRKKAGRAIIVDWQLWHAHIGPRDLAYMMTIFWDSARRAEMEEKLLRRYHRRLLARGVTGYSWEQCWRDYRWSAIRNIFIPAWQWLQGMDIDVCRERTLNALNAFEDLHCLELIEN